MKPSNSVPVAAPRQRLASPAKPAALPEALDGAKSADQVKRRTRPKRDGLWVRLSLKSGEVIEGTVENSLASFPASGNRILAIQQSGTDEKHGRQLKLEASAIQSAVILGVIGQPELAGKAEWRAYHGGRPRG